MPRWNCLPQFTAMALVAAACIAAAPQADAALIAYWNFNDSNATVDSGVGTLVINTSAGSSTSFGTSAGTTLNALFSDPAEEGIRFQNIDTNSTQNIVITFSTLGQTDVEISFAGSRFNNTGNELPSTGYTMEYDVGSGFTGLTDIGSQTTSFQVVNSPAAWGTALNNQAIVSVRFNIPVTTTAGGASNDAYFIDNVQVNAVPEPSSFVLAALGLLGGLVAIPRRRGVG